MAMPHGAWTRSGYHVDATHVTIQTGRNSEWTHCNCIFVEDPVVFDDKISNPGPYAYTETDMALVSHSLLGHPPVT
jgi:hypothetical protein